LEDTIKEMLLRENDTDVLYAVQKAIQVVLEDKKFGTNIAILL